ncbi:MAG: helix-turn-helix transcriptional regulator [Frankiales bacterium]|nr:helix-turn-helix transcriptional regulator [Frankiales bacterium]
MISDRADTIRTRRLSIPMTIDEAAAAGGVSPTTWSRIERGEPVRALSLAAVDRALAWESGSAERWLREGKTPRVSSPVLGDIVPPPDLVGPRDAVHPMLRDRSLPPHVPVGANVDPELLAELDAADPATVQRVKDYLRGLQEGKRE